MQHAYPPTSFLPSSHRPVSFVCAPECYSYFIPEPWQTYQKCHPAFPNCSGTGRDQAIVLTYVLWVSKLFLSGLSLFCYTRGGEHSNGTVYDASCLLLPSFCSYLFNRYCFLPHGATAPMGQGLLIIKAPRSHSYTPHLVRVHWMSDQPDAETSTWQHNTHNRQPSMPPVGFKPAIPESQQPQSHALEC